MHVHVKTNPSCLVYDLLLLLLLLLLFTKNGRGGFKPSFARERDQIVRLRTFTLSFLMFCNKVLFRKK